MQVIGTLVGRGTMKLKTSKLTYKSLFGYSLVVIALLVVSVPVFANTNPGNKLLPFSTNSDTGNTPQSARPLSKGINVNHLNPGEENWYIYSRDNFSDPNFSWVSLAMRFQSEAIISPEQVNFQVFAQEQANSWFQNATPATEAMGTGLPSPLKKTNQNLIETFWTGQVAEQEHYYVRVFNKSPFGLDYTLEAKAEQAAVTGATPASLETAAVPANTRQMAWTLTAQAINNMPAEQAADWMQKAQAVGWLVTEGTLAEEVPNPGQADPQTLWALTAQAVEGQDAQTAAQWLIQADSLGWLAIPLNTLKNPTEDVQPEETGGGGDDEDSEPPAQPIQPDEVYSPVNIYPNEPLTFDFNGVNSGRLGPYGEHWYELVRDDFDEDIIENMKMTMFFTPRVGYVSDRVNFEIFPAGQYHIWERGDSNYMEHLGLGLWVSRDEDPHTGERLWNGTLVDGDRYLVKVKNGTPDVVDYYLFPNDVENAELGNPTLHRIGGASSATKTGPYSVSPPTRPGPPPEPGAGPPEAIPLKIGVTKGTLEAGEEVWYKFHYFDPHNETTPEHDFLFYLTNTPQDEIRARHADFAIYPGGQLHIWTRGTVDQLDPLGTSSPSPYELEDEKALQVLWDGQLMEDQVYYVKVYNHDIGPLEYELEIQGGP